jgi:hypothetical protein
MMKGLKRLQETLATQGNIDLPPSKTKRDTNNSLTYGNIIGNPRGADKNILCMATKKGKTKKNPKNSPRTERL